MAAKIATMNYNDLTTGVRNDSIVNPLEASENYIHPVLSAERATLECGRHRFKIFSEVCIIFIVCTCVIVSYPTVVP